MENIIDPREIKAKEGKIVISYILEQILVNLSDNENNSYTQKNQKDFLDNMLNYLESIGISIEIDYNISEDKNNINENIETLLDKTYIELSKIYNKNTDKVYIGKIEDYLKLHGDKLIPIKNEEEISKKQALSCFHNGLITVSDIMNGYPWALQSSSTLFIHYSNEDKIPGDIDISINENNFWDLKDALVYNPLLYNLSLVNHKTGQVVADKNEISELSSSDISREIQNLFDKGQLKYSFDVLDPLSGIAINVELFPEGMGNGMIQPKEITIDGNVLTYLGNTLNIKSIAGRNIHILTKKDLTYFYAMVFVHELGGDKLDSQTKTKSHKRIQNIEKYLLTIDNEFDVLDIYETIHRIIDLYISKININGNIRIENDLKGYLKEVVELWKGKKTNHYIRRNYYKERVDKLINKKIEEVDISENKKPEFNNKILELIKISGDFDKKNKSTEDEIKSYILDTVMRWDIKENIWNKIISIFKPRDQRFGPYTRIMKNILSWVIRNIDKKDRDKLLSIYGLFTIRKIIDKASKDGLEYINEYLTLLDKSLSETPNEDIKSKIVSIYTDIIENSLRGNGEAQIQSVDDILYDFHIKIKNERNLYTKVNKIRDHYNYKIFDTFIYKYKKWFKISYWYLKKEKEGDEICQNNKFCNYDIDFDGISALDEVEIKNNLSKLSKTDNNKWKTEQGGAEMLNLARTTLLEILYSDKISTEKKSYFVFQLFDVLKISYMSYIKDHYEIDANFELQMMILSKNYLDVMSNFIVNMSHKKDNIEDLQ